MSSTVRPAAQKHTVVEEGSTFKGTLTSSCPIHVHGRVEGELETPALTVSATGAVHGRAKVGAVRSQGELSGEFDADSIELAGTVKDNTVIRARSLEVKLASTHGRLQVIFGECELAIGEPPTESDMVEPPVVKEEPSTLAAAIASIIPLVEEQAPAAPAVVQPPPADASTSADDEEDDEEDDDREEAEEPGAQEPALQTQGEPRGKRRKKRKQLDDTMGKTGWSQPPSQPPPGS